MGEDPRANGTSALSNGHAAADVVVLAEGDPVALRRQIEATRSDLGDTVAALAIKADVKAQAHDRVEQLKTKAKSNPLPLVAAGVVAAGLVALRIARR
ncbi:DUF3618 domain-containing protein [Conexibacter sp. JD483]|uniref:DUF3618 domain-containing protein n=1 Tax=unclassified Conexibacter TaxID=2627773 RepID=UPI0027165C3E|nr:MULTISPECIES: DUF3618 domain-containing protein [unclassified Conexibacter]MDO8185008.1 DUF3618 domain-containing protein [Conexibacter sp. CPCC 205706]MDO8198152.1 DUF3618 domain-containing protein [Conexibacter sp. CPCC 205762]MDR9373185.1 DUF3618 domain-containing protein [Conexibacter sp. JD483]